jgi:hypothetical protein
VITSNSTIFLGANILIAGLGTQQRESLRQAEALFGALLEGGSTSPLTPLLRGEGKAGVGNGRAINCCAGGSMIYVYINYPNPHATIHHNSNCQSIRQANKQGQRTAIINVATISNELSQFAQRRYTFGANSAQNDIWLEIDFQDIGFETAVAAYILTLIAQHYTPLRGVQLQPHC